MSAIVSASLARPAARSARLVVRASEAPAAPKVRGTVFSLISPISDFASSSAPVALWLVPRSPLAPSPSLPLVPLVMRRSPRSAPSAARRCGGNSPCGPHTKIYLFSRGGRRRSRLVYPAFLRLPGRRRHPCQCRGVAPSPMASPRWAPSRLEAGGQAPGPGFCRPSNPAWLFPPPPLFSLLPLPVVRSASTARSPTGSARPARSWLLTR